MSKEKNIYDYVLKDIKNIINNIGILFLIVIFSEAIRKFTLHSIGVPYFVLDNEPLITTFGYGIVFIGVLISILIYGFGVFLIERVKISKIDFKISVNFLRSMSICLPFLVIMCILSMYIFNDDFEKTLYVNSDFKVEVGEEYSTIYNLSENIPILFCKKTFFSDDCLTEIKK